MDCERFLEDVRRGGWGGRMNARSEGEEEKAGTGECTVVISGQLVTTYHT